MKQLAVLIMFVAGLLVALPAKASFSAPAQAYMVSGNVGTDFGTYSWVADGQAGGGLTGTIHLTSVDNPGQSLVAVCLDVKSDLILGRAYTFSATTPFAQAGNGSIMSWGATSAARDQALQNAAYIFYNNVNKLASGTVSDKAAVQLAVWAALYDTQASGARFTINDPGQRFYVTGGDASTLSEADLLIGSMFDAGTFDPYTGSILQPLSGGSVDHGAQEVFAAPVPEASTIFAGILLALPLLVGSFRSLKKLRAT